MFRIEPIQNQRRQPQPLLKSFPAPTAGWIANRNLAQPQGQGLPQGAAILDNFFPTTTSAVLRRGKQLYATLGEGVLPVTALFAYVVGNQQQLFGATATTIYDITTISSPSNYVLGTEGGDIIVTDEDDQIGALSTQDMEVLEDQTGGDWVVVQFATTGGIYLIGVNGEDIGFQYDGTDFGPYDENSTPAIEFPTGVDLTTADLSYVWAFKNRLFFVQKDSLDVWYLPVDQIGGELVRFPLGGVFQRGGTIMFGATWSLDSGNQGGLSEQCVFVTTEGEVAVYQGSNPSDANDWSKVGVYRIGRPLGHKAWIRAGGDLVIATSIGFVPLSQAIQRDYAALSPSAVSFPIEDAWNEATVRRGLMGWNCMIWPENQMVAVSPPHAENTEPVLLVANARTGAWARYTNWNARCMEVFQGQLYFGSEEGKVFAANISGNDDGETYTGVFLPLFEDLGAPASIKAGRVARAVGRAKATAQERVALSVDFDLEIPPRPDAAPVGTGNEWGTAIWGQSTWSAPTSSVINQRWRSIGGYGYALSCSLQVTSGSIAPLDYEIIRIDMTYQLAGPVT